MAKRDKLTKNQKRQVAKNRNSANLLSLSGEQSHSKKGLIIGRFGNQADVLDIEENRVHRCFLRQHLGAPVPGDNVLFHTELNSNEKSKGVIESIKERETLLERPSQHKGIKPIVANVNLIFVVVAPLPEFSSVLLDRYLVATNNANIETVIVVNKSDMQSEMERQNINAILAAYAEIGYSIINISANSNKGKEGFLGFSKDKASILVGQSGVGKSSIINWLFPNESLATQSISINSKLGQHTTTASRIYRFQENTSGYLVDSPGIREFGLWHLTREQIALGYVEFQEYIGSCKFRDCKHINEPGCKIIQAVKDNQINQQRWQNYVKIVKNNEKP